MFNFISNLFTNKENNTPVVKDMPSVTMMAFGKAQEIKEAVEIKRYVGIGNIKVLAVNPDAKQINELMGFTPNEEPKYFGTRDVDGTTVPTAMVRLIVKAESDKNNGVETVQMMNFFLEGRYEQGSQSGKYHVIDEFGRDAWATKDVIEKKEKIYYKDGAMEANISQNYRPLYVGEKALNDFLKTYLNIPNPVSYVNGSWVKNPDVAQEDCVCRLENTKDYFKGNFSEIKDALALMPNNIVKVLFYIHSNNEGREYQQIYTQLVMRGNARNTDKFAKEIQDRKDAGALQNDTFEFTDLHEYAPQPTDLSTAPAATNDDPFGDPWA